MRLKQPLLVILLLASFRSFSQEKFIEVTVSDTAWVKPNQFIYTITFDPSAAFDIADTSANNDEQAYEYRKRQFVYKRKMLLDSLTNALAAKGFCILPTNIKDVYSTFDRSKFYDVRIFTRSFDSVKILYNAIQDKPVFFAGITSAKAADETPYYKKLYQKLIVQARNKAGTLARLGGLKLGGIISLKEEGQAQTAGGWTAYPPLSAISEIGYQTTLLPNKFMTSVAGPVDKYDIEGSLTVRFGLE